MRKWALTVLAVLFASALAAPPAEADSSYNGLALTPPMGFNNWQHYRCDITEQIIVDNAKALVSTGLAKHGYNYVNVDDCWMKHERDADGVLRASPATFPHGIKWLADYVHGLGLKFGIYQDGGYQTCGGFPGMYGHIKTDADTFASWGVDYLKLDYCYQPTDQYPGKTAAEVAKIVYSDVSQALLDTHRPIVFSESAPAYYCCSGQDFTDIMSWIGHTGNLWRFGSDIQPSWSSVLTNYSEGNTPGLASYAGPGHWNDADMLLAGTAGTSAVEQQSQFSLWAIMASPLLLSADIGAMSRQTVAMLSNEDVLAIDQDRLGAQGTIVQGSAEADVLARPLANGDVAVALFNKSAVARNISVTAKTAGLPSAKSYQVNDLWSHQSTETTGVIAADVPSHGVALYRVRAARPHSAPLVSLTPANPQWTSLQSGPVTVTITDHGSNDLCDVVTRLSAPAGWQVKPGSQRIPRIPAGGTASVTFDVTPAAQPPGITYTDLGVSTGFRWGPGRSAQVDGPATATVVTPYPSVQSAFDNVSITDDASSDPGGPGFDNYQGTFSAQALAAAGVTPGGTLDRGGLTFAWPSGRPDNVIAHGQLITYTGRGATLGFLASAGFGPAGGTGTVVYTDGSTQPFTISAPDWTSIPSDANVAISTPYHNIPGKQLQITSAIYLVTAPIDPAKTIARIVLPEATGHSTLSTLHIFAVAVGGGV